MKKNISILLVILMLGMTFATYATAIGVEILPDNGPGVEQSIVGESSAGIIGAKQYNFEEKYIYLFKWLYSGMPYKYTNNGRRSNY